MTKKDKNIPLIQKAPEVQSCHVEHMDWKKKKKRSLSQV